MMVRDCTIDNYNALIVSPGDLKPVADAVLKILRSDKLKEKLIEYGAKTARQWTWDKIADIFEQAIKGL
jgi:glycosyltransferase involved in cell wall biosynthesis